MRPCVVQLDRAIENWVQDLAACAQNPQLTLGGPERVEEILAHDPTETPLARRQRASRVCRAYRYASSNAAAFEIIGEYERTGPHSGNLSLRVVFALFAVFRSEAFEEDTPPLEVVVDLVARSMESSSGGGRL